MPDIKISDEAFLSILRENGGLYAATAKAIEEQFGVKYSRQAVRQRALDHPDELADIEEQAKDIAEAGLLSLMQDTDPRIRLDATKFYLNTKGKARGYTQRQEITGADGNPLAITWHEERTYETKVSETGPELKIPDNGGVIRKG